MWAWRHATGSLVTTGTVPMFYTVALVPLGVMGAHHTMGHCLIMRLTHITLGVIVMLAGV